MKPTIVAVFTNNETTQTEILFFNDREVLKSELKERVKVYRSSVCEDTSFFSSVDKGIDSFVDRISAIEESMTLFCDDSLECVVSAILIPTNENNPVSDSNFNTRNIHKWICSYARNGIAQNCQIYDKADIALKAMSKLANTKQGLDKSKEHTFTIKQANLLYECEEHNVKVELKDGAFVEISQIYAKKYPEGKIELLLGIARGDGELILCDEWLYLYNPILNDWKRIDNCKSNPLS